MAEVIIKTDGTCEGTSCTIDGKEVKNWCDMSLYATIPTEDDQNRYNMEPSMRFNITTEEEDAKTGMVVRTSKMMREDELVEMDAVEVADMNKKRKIQKLYFGD